MNKKRTLSAAESRQYFADLAAIEQAKNHALQLTRDYEEKRAARNAQTLASLRERRKNPAPKKKVTRRIPNLNAARAMLADFSDVKPAQVVEKRVDKPHAFDVGLRVGQLIAVAYDVAGSKRIHKFRKSSAPDLISSVDGKQLAIVGGKYRFTKRGIVDV